MNHSDTLTKLAAALAKAQAEIENASKNATNPHFRSHYADLPEIINTARPVLAKHGLALLQLPGYADGVATVEGVLLHESGEWIAGTAGARVPKDDPQGVGSATTYLRRYQAAAMLFMGQEDDDANSASEPKKAPKLSGADQSVLAKGKGLWIEAAGLGLEEGTPEERKAMKKLAFALDKRDVETVKRGLPWLEEHIEKAKVAA